VCSVVEANTCSGLQSMGCVVLISPYGKGNKLPVMLFNYHFVVDVVSQKHI